MTIKERGRTDGDTGGRVDGRVILLHLGLIGFLFLLQFVLPAYHHANLVRIMVLAVYAMGYNLLLGYTGLLSLGHAMFFAAGIYGAGLGVQYLGVNSATGFGLGVLAGFGLSLAVGLVILRTSGVAFMIVTLMFAQAGYLLTLYFGDITRGDEGFVLGEGTRQFTLGPLHVDLLNPALRYNLALILFAFALLLCLAIVRSPLGRVLVAIRENEERSRMLGYNAYLYKLLSLTLSGTLSAAAGAAYAMLFAYVGSTFATIQYSIYALLWVLLGGVGTTIGPLIGTLLMFYLVDLASDYTSSYLIAVGVILILLVLWFPKGLLGTLRERRMRWLP